MLRLGSKTGFDRSPRVSLLSCLIWDRILFSILQRVWKDAEVACTARVCCPVDGVRVRGEMQPHGGWLREALSLRAE